MEQLMKNCHFSFEDLPKGYQERRRWIESFTCQEQCGARPGFLPNNLRNEEYLKLFGEDSGYNGEPGSCPAYSPQCMAGQKDALREAVEVLINKGVPPQRAKETTLRFESQANRAVRKYEKNNYSNGMGLVLCGDTGRGKTCAAVGFLKHQLLKWGTDRFKFQFWQISDLFTTLQGDREGYSTILSKIKQVHVLVLDELGMEKKTDWKQEILDSIINHREGGRLPTIITANKNPENFERDFGARIASRLLGEWGQVEVITDRDFRREK